MKQAVKVFGVIGIVLFVVIVFFMGRMLLMSNRIQSAYREVSRIDLSVLPDGRYRGAFSDFLLAVELELTVRNGEISSLEILRQECGPGYEALQIVDRILAEQTPLVNTVSGATGSSKAIMSAAYRALRSGMQ
jgi:uncharacterized protein with FMN-binding domain